MKVRAPLLTAAVVLAAFVVAAWPGAGERLIYDRAAILHGEWWRLVTGHWVHFSASHLGFDALALGVGGSLLERHSRGRLALTLVTGAVAIPLLLLGFQPGLDRYAGLSGLVTGVLALGGVDALRKPGRTRVVGAVILLGIGVKITVESIGGGFALTSINIPGVEPATLAHLVGGLVGVVVGAAPCLGGLPCNRRYFFVHGSLMRNDRIAPGSSSTAPTASSR